MLHHGWTKTIMLSESAQSQKTAYCMIPFMWNIQNGWIYRDRTQIRGCSGLGVVDEWAWELKLMGMGFPPEWKKTKINLQWLLQSPVNLPKNTKSDSTLSVGWTACKLYLKLLKHTHTHTHIIVLKILFQGV